ncbi:MAG: TetR family transcriptional regulator [Solirubrobacterales bacterium]|jgi:AcrR family transcriptional regulator|nr:TetR family transcriptional regulator [Solirubrobacterales bacterium]
MEAATPRPIDGARATAIVDAMRLSVARRGVAASTFEHVAGAAGVSRGLLHYYFGTKERLLAEVVRRDCDLRMALLDEQLAGASSAEDFVGLLRVTLEELVREDPDFITVVFELFLLSRRNEEVAVEFAELMRRTREAVAAILARKSAEGVLVLRAEPDAVGEVLFGLADGLALRMLGEPDRDWGPTIASALDAVRALLTDS